jgi:hypothetical protein
MKNRFLKGLLLVAFLLSSVNATFVFDTSGDSMQIGDHVPVDRPAALDIGGCQLFPDDNYWNTPVDDLSVHPSSAAWVNSIGANDEFHMDFGSGTWNGGPIGIPYNVLSGSTVTKYTVDFYYPNESDPGPYPLSANPLREWGSDHHILVVDTDDCRLYELYDASKSGGQWDAGSGAIWDLSSNALRPNTWTSADAAGLPILPGLARYEEVVAGEINHALRFTASQTAGFIWPARHQTSNAQNGIPPMGARFRLKADYNISGFTPDMQVILRAMKKYGIVLADNGSDWYVSGVPNAGWDNDELHDLDVLRGSNFEAVDTSELMVDYNSAEASIVPRNVETYIAGSLKGNYGIRDQTARRFTYAGFSGGPVRVVNTESQPVVSSLRLLYNNKTFSELMGVPTDQLSNDYWLPYYANISGTDTQIRFTNTHETLSTTVNVYLGDNPTPVYTKVLAASSTDRINLSLGTKGGPVHIVGTPGVDILAGMRVIYGGNKSFDELMAFPTAQLDTEYWFPFYNHNNVNLDTQVRVANTSSTDSAPVDIYIGDTLMDTTTIAPLSAYLKSFPGVNGGPVRVVSTSGTPVPIVASLRLLYNNKTFSELMGVPTSQLSNDYWLPYYANISGTDTQIRFTNTHATLSTTVDVYLGSNPTPVYTKTLLPKTADRFNLPLGTTGGPVHIVGTSGVNILAGMRVIYGGNSSFDELSAYPDALLSAEYWFPFYNHNNVNLNTEVRIGVP